MIKTSNCLLQAIYVFAVFFKQGARINYDFNSPKQTISFYCDVQGIRWRFRRKIMRSGNKSMLYFKGYNSCAKVNEERIFNIIN